MTNFNLKEKRTIRIPQTPNFIFLDYEWKVSFPKDQMLKSYRYSQFLKIDLNQEVIKVSIIQKKKEEEQLFIRKIFYSEIDSLNKNICNFAVAEFEK